jgi:hypothetical protein
MTFAPAGREAISRRHTRRLLSVVGDEDGDRMGRVRQNTFHRLTYDFALRAVAF